MTDGRKYSSAFEAAQDGLGWEDLCVLFKLGKAAAWEIVRSAHGLKASKPPTPDTPTVELEFGQCGKWISAVSKRYPTAGDLMKADDADLLKLPSIGPFKLTIIRNALL